jgi:hypothetical protein
MSVFGLVCNMVSVLGVIRLWGCACLEASVCLFERVAGTREGVKGKW